MNSVIDTQPEALSVADDVDEPILPSLKVLIAEDDFLTARKIARDVTALSHKVIGPAASGDAAVELARQHRPDIALLDICMPGKNGIEAAAILFRQMGIPVVILSAYSDDAYLEGTQKAGVFSYLVKPVSRDQLQNHLAVAWATFHRQRALSEQTDALKERLRERREIEQAKSLLIARLKIDEEEAMRRLRLKARQTSRKLGDMARAILQTLELFEPIDHPPHQSAGRHHHHG